MSLSANTARLEVSVPASAIAWRVPRAARGFRERLAKVATLTIASLLLAQYLGGFLFLWWVKADVKLATPLTLARYAYYYSARADIAVRLALCEGVGLAAVLMAASAAFIPKRRSLHGDARPARLSEVRAAGLFADHGILLGKLGSRYLTLAGQQGVALAAPPRSGKGTGIVVPNLLNWPGSVLCIDIKRENWRITAGFRAACGQACYLFDPFAEDRRTARWNPFTYVSEDPPRRLNDLQRIAEMLYPDPPNVDPFWTASARSLFLGIALYLFETPSLKKTIGEVLRQGMASDDEGFGAHWKRIIEGRKRSPFPLSGQCVRSLYDVIDLAPVTASSIRKTFTSRLDLWMNPILDEATSASDFDLRELRSKPISIYVGVNPDDLHRLRPVLSLLCQQAIGLQTRELPEQNPHLVYQVMMMLDEFTALGRIPIIAEAISYLPGYNVRTVLILQALAQLREVYGAHAAETMLKSLAARVVFAPKDFSDAREISDELGFTTVKVRTVSKPFFSFDSRTRSRTVNVSEQRRALLLPQEVKELGTEEAIIFCEGLRAIRCRKIRYFSDRLFKRRLLPPPESPAPRRAPD
ncbi:MAG: type IV secretory system conjugative DNA transfer family protein, partial [Steroidobacteraceae bacterium]